MKLIVRTFLMLAAACAAAVSGAQQYPAKPVRVLVGYAPGGATDINARIVAQKLNEKWGQPRSKV
jgi:tripartite-type tricarboxylate transporter receptor subunit TctC